LACPQVSGSESLLATIAVTHGVGVVEMLLDRQREAVAQRTRGLREVLHKELTGRLDFETTWDRSFGRALQALGSDEVDGVDALVEVALRLAAQGQPGCWTATLREQRRHCWGDRWLLSAAREISVDSDGTAAMLRVTTPAGDCIETLFQRSNGQEWFTQNAERLIQVGTRRPITLFAAEAVPPDMVMEDDFHSIFEFPPITFDVVQPFSEALELLERHAPEYMVWVERVLRGVLVCRCHESRTRSSSWVHAPGVALMSASDNPIVLAEMMVHESSHQYYYLASRLGATVNAGEGEPQRYYSPAVQQDRPLSKILIGYHAFANMLIFYRTLLRNGFAGHAYCTEMEARLSAESEILARPLRDSPLLTTIGRDLFEPLQDQLGEPRLAGTSS
jgi:hypothetical protein